MGNAKGNLGGLLAGAPEMQPRGADGKDLR